MRPLNGLRRFPKKQRTITLLKPLAVIGSNEYDSIIRKKVKRMRYKYEMFQSLNCIICFYISNNNVNV